MKSTTIFILDKYISNIEILKTLCNNSLIRTVSYRWSFIYSCLTNTKGGDRFVVPWDIQHPKLSPVSNNPQRFFISQSIKEQFEKLKFESSRYGEHVCFHNRDPLYLKQLNLEDGNFHDYRDFPFETYRASCDYLRAGGITSIRVGKSDDVKCYDFDYWDLSGRNHQDSVNVAAIGFSRFFVTGNTGISQVARLFRRPILAVNYAPCRVAEFSALSRDSIVIPKLIFLAKKNRYMNLVELIRVGDAFDIHYKGNFFAENEMLLVNNNETDILDGVVEMESRLNSNAEDYYETRRELNKLEGLCSDFAFVRRILNINFCMKFLDRHPFLLDF